MRGLLGTASPPDKGTPGDAFPVCLSSWRCQGCWAEQSGEKIPVPPGHHWALRQPCTAPHPFLWELKTSPVALLLLGRFCVWSRASSAGSLPSFGAGRRYSLRNTLSLTLAWASHPQGVHMTVLLWTCLLRALSSGHQGPHLTPPGSLGADPRLLQRNGHSWAGLGLITLCWFWCPHHKAGYLLFTVSPPGNQQRSKWEKRL